MTKKKVVDLTLVKNQMDHLPSYEISYDSRAVANRILLKSRIKNQGIDSLSASMLMKLVYFSHGWSLVFSDVSLVSQSPTAGHYGPRYGEIYEPFSGYCGFPIKTLIVNEETKLPYSGFFTENQNKVMDFVLEKYEEYFHPSFSFDSENQQGAPWDIIRKNYGTYFEMPNDLMKTYYTEKAKQKGISTI
ncbi:Panacea domain-containing protein [Candidatus Liberibacter sp.]|uniref:Panacea domain-containing protein n=1 Tax=Candidatus Liberibacter sp. TaxID=34022 RepID=UPI0015F4F111|nr:type II toxin-antitoxin system antitoxin SocA domain-containing protein [Candidatus Liberibacter sp.]MBA5724474.1 DUF4065 domain-containing protein [Candidatus Liberibacter sp.]